MRCKESNPKIAGAIRKSLKGGMLINWQVIAIDQETIQKGDFLTEPLFLNILLIHQLLYLYDQYTTTAYLC